MTLAATGAPPLDASQLESQIQADELVRFFPTYARRTEAGNGWIVAVHGVVCKSNARYRKRVAAVGLIRMLMKLSRRTANRDIFNRRVHPFLVKAQADRAVYIRLGAGLHQAGISDDNGHFQRSLLVSDAELGAAPAVGHKGDGRLKFDAVARPDVHSQAAQRTFAGEVHFLDRTGVSVISDIDDTFKVTQVTDRKQLLRNTFFRPFNAVPGMVDRFRDWSAAGAAFHYVSASPWQLAEPLDEFFGEVQLPAGTLHLRHFRFRDRVGFRGFERSDLYKRHHIEPILSAFPGRRFVLVGDTGEHDPEIYGAVARRFPQQVRQILIRDISGLGAAHPRFAAAFDGTACERIKIFTHADELRDWQLPS